MKTRLIPVVECLLRSNRFIETILVAALLVFTACDEREYPSDKVDELRKAETANLTDYYASMSAADKDALDGAMRPGPTVGVGFMRGVDASMVAALEDAGIVYYDEAGNARDFFEILKESGVNWVRLRIWNDPRYDPADKDSTCNGGNNLAVTLRLARRAKAAGLRLLLDFHYSDRWADPSHQLIPEMWMDITDPADMAAELKAYTKDVLAALKKAGCAPDMVQIGNEITSGMLLHDEEDENDHTCKNTNHPDVAGNSTTPAGGSTSNLVTYLNAGSAAVREVLPDAKVMVHIERATKKADDFYQDIKAVDYDVIGLSWYPFYNSHGTLADLKGIVQKLVANGSNAYGATAKQVVIAENGYPWNMWNNDDDAGFDDLGDMVWWTGSSSTENANASMVTDSGSVPTGMNTITVTEKGADHTVLDASIKNQALEIRAVIDTAAAGGAVGYFYWGGDWVTWGKGSPYAGTMYSNHENQALFGLDHKVLPSMKVLGAHW